MAYSELIKNFSKIREYVSQFYIYGFKTRSEYTAKSARSYDNERRRIESWLGEYMRFRKDVNGKNSFLALDSRAISHNPLYTAFKAKSFTENDINLHFYLLDILAGGEEKTVKEILNAITEDYLCAFEDAEETDESTLRKKLKEYENLGLIKSRKNGRELVYARCDDAVNLDSWKEAAAYFSEEDPLGVVGSFLLDKYESVPQEFTFKHHYILHALESEVLESLFEAMRGHQKTQLTIYVPRHGNTKVHTLLPLKIYCSTQSGRRYVLGYHYDFRRLMFFRLDNIKKVKLLEADENFEKHFRDVEAHKSKLWGVSITKSRTIDHLEMTVYASENEPYIVNRLEREKRGGSVEPMGENLYRFTADVFDAMEMLPWIRTFTGRIVSLACTNQTVVNTFYGDFAKMLQMYGGDEHAF